MALSAAADTGVAETVHEVRKKMGSRFEVIAVHPERAVAEKAVEAAWAEIDRLEAMISSWRETSETSEINRQAGIGPVAVSPELFNLIRRSLKVSELTGGAFDITFDSVGKLWDFKSGDGSVPSQEAIAEAVARVGYEKVVLDPQKRTVFLTHGGTRIGFGAIGKGFAANRAAQVLKERGIPGGLVNAGGDLYAYGHKDDGSRWHVGIADPATPDHTFAHVQLTDTAVVTSGDYENYFEFDGVRYAHILDPRTGWPVRFLRSVTVVCPDAELADALATSIFVLGPEEGLRLINHLNGVEALLVDGDGKVSYSDQIRAYFTKEDENT